MLNGKLQSENKSKKDNFKAPESNKEVLLESHDWKWETCEFFSGDSDCIIPQDRKTSYYKLQMKTEVDNIIPEAFLLHSNFIHQAHGLVFRVILSTSFSFRFNFQWKFYSFQVLFALNQTLWQHEVSRSKKNAIHYTTEDLIHHYNCGDLNSIIFNHDTAQVPNLVNSSLPPQDLQTAKMIDDYFRDELINKRNERMTERVINLLKAHPQKSFFFAFGAG